jgi:hypothetical protein
MQFRQNKTTHVKIAVCTQQKQFRMTLTCLHYFNFEPVSNLE